MPRIPDHELIRIKRESDLVSLVRESGVELSRQGKDWLGLCPFHPDREPSLVISPARNLWHCLGACSTGGSAIDWVMRDQGVGFRAAVEILEHRLGGAPPAEPRELSHEPALPAVPPAERAALLEEVVSHYQESLAGSEAAQSYARSRGLTAAAIKRFRLGYADRTLGPSLQADPDGAAKRESLKALGVLRPSTGHEHLTGCLVIPILGVDGTVLGLYGRRIRAGSPAHLYLPGPRSGIFNPEGLFDTKELILCESLIDALTFWSHGFEQVTCAWGVNGFTHDHLAALKSYGIERLLIAYDPDQAGNEAAEALAAKLAPEGVACSRVSFPKGLDANAYAQKVTPAKESLRLVLEAARPLAGSESAATPPPVPTPPSASTEPEPPPANKSAPADPKQPIDLPIGDRRWRARGLDRNLSYQKLQVLLRVAKGDAFFVDTVDLCQAKQRSNFIRSASAELEIEESTVKKDLGKLHLRLEELQDRLIQTELSPKASEPEQMAPEAERRALEYLRQPHLLAAILEDFARCGVVGEEINKLTGYVAATSRLLERPLAVIIQSSSAAGKSSLMEAILAFVPIEERVQYSAMTGQSLFYMGETDLSHKILAIVEEEGAERASYALKLLQSEGELTIASTGKDPQSGRLVTHEYHVEGPVMIFLTTTSIEIDEELLNRCLVLTVDESREQTRAIHELQRERRTLEGLKARRQRSTVVELHRNAQRLLRPLPVVNPYARRLTFLDSQTRTRRDHEKYLTLIDAITLLHQHQRPRRRMLHAGESVEYLEVDVADIEAANRLAGEVLGRSLDELPPQTRRFLALLDGLVSGHCETLELDRCDYRFTRRAVCEGLGWSLTQVRLHLERLVEHEYVIVHRGGRGQTMVYELVYDGQGAAGGRFLIQLLDPQRLEDGTNLTGSEHNLAGSEGHLADLEGEMAGSYRGQIAPLSGGWRGAKRAAKERKGRDLGKELARSSEKARIGGPENDGPSGVLECEPVLASG